MSEFAVQARGSRRVDGIDLLRGVSILLVLLNHIHLRLVFANVDYTHRLPLQLVYSLGWNGQAGVQIFFVVSGYLITSTSMRRWGPPGALRIGEFYLLRLARIGPLLALLLAVLSLLHFAHLPQFTVSEKTGGLGGALFAALTLHINLLEATRGYLPGSWDILWSLSIEEAFYLFFPLAARVFRQTRFLIPLLLVLVVAGPFARAKAFDPNPVWREYSYLGGMDAIAMGCLTAILLHGRRLPRPGIYGCGLTGAGLLGFTLLFSLQAYKLGLGRNGLSMTILGLGSCFAVAAAAASGWEAPRLLAPVLALGRLSYEVYLTHMFFVLGLFALFAAAGKPVWAVPLLFTGVIVGAGLFGWATSRAYTDLSNHWIRALGGLRPDMQDTALAASE